jgi:hypothetical protein
MSGIELNTVTESRQLDRARTLGQLVGRGTKEHHINKYCTHSHTTCPQHMTAQISHVKFKSVGKPEWKRSIEDLGVMEG